jgi:hypothetical protein
MTITVTLVTGGTASVASVGSVDVAGGALVVYAVAGTLLAGYASGQWKSFTATATP